MLRMEPTAADSLADILARVRPGTAIATMMPMMATTSSNSMSVKPSRLFMAVWLRGNERPTEHDALAW